MPLDQDITSRHGELEPRVARRPDVMYDRLEVRDQREHREHRFHQQAVQQCMTVCKGIVSQSLVSGNSGGFLLPQAVGHRGGTPLPTPMPLHPLGQMLRD